jgi:UDP-N-acetylmuramate--L-alanine ligase
MINLEGISEIYFIGIGGIAMSAAAGLAKDLGYQVSGSDSKEIYAPAKDVLDKFAIPYNIGYDVKNIEQAHADLYIVSAGEDSSNPEVAYLESQDIPVYSFSELLGQLAADKIRIVVAGTNGKSTTTGLLGHVMADLDDSSFMAGAVLQQYESNYHSGTGHYFIFEGDEYKALANDPTPKFHYYKPDTVILTNLEYDHPDMYGSLDEIKDEFRLLLANMPDDGLIIYNADDANLVQLVHESNVASFSYGIVNPADYKVDNIVFHQKATTFTITCEKWDKPEEYSIMLAGQLNIYNALGPIALLRSLGFQREQISPLVETYWGVKRRFEHIGEKNGIHIYDDYAHFPTAIRETLSAAKTRYPEGRIFAVFEPHTYSRTEATLTDLATSFAAADMAVIAEVYPARERKSPSSITGKQVVAAIAKTHKNVKEVKDRAEALQLLKKELQPGDVVIVMAVGSFNTLAYELMENL